jgi:DNA-directed RNA polymerase specialized sigma24 family protein
MSTRWQGKKRVEDAGWPMLVRGGLGLHDPAEEVALVAQARRETLLRVHRHRLRREDLEDCLSQATLELVARVRQGAVCSSRLHLANTLEQRFLSRIYDRRRALGGRSAMQAALDAALPLGDPDWGNIDVVDARADVEKLVMLRLDLRRLKALASELTPDQRIVLACQVGLGMDCREFCERFGWSPEKFRKVAQRARMRLTRLLENEVRDSEERSVPLRTAASEKATGTRL